ncbi:MAG: MFS transporter [Dehalococcoidia bacterium]|nr:MFS transporter [Dehalococcoidia bacterium]
MSPELRQMPERDAPPAAELRAEPSPVPGVSRNVFVLGWVSLASDIASEMLYPLIPIFLTVTLGAPVAFLGLIEGVAEGTASIMKVASGWYSDRLALRRPLVAAGYGLSALGKLLLATAFHWPQVLFARAIDRFGKGVRTSPRDALIADSSLPEAYGRAFGFHRAADTAGAVLGPLIGLAFLTIAGEDNLRPVFLMAAVPGIASVALIAFVRDRRWPPQPTRQVKGGPRIDLSGASAVFWMFLGISLLFALGNSSDTFLILRANDLGLSLTIVILMYVVYNTSYSLLSLPAGIAADRVGKRTLVTGGFFVYGLVYLGFALTGQGSVLWPLFLTYGVYMAFTDGQARALVAELAPEEKRGTFLGLYHTGIGLMAVAASVLAGVLWDVVGKPAPFFLGASTAFAAAALMLLLPRQRAIHSWGR